MASSTSTAPSASVPTSRSHSDGQRQTTKRDDSSSSALAATSNSSLTSARSPTRRRSLRTGREAKCRWGLCTVELARPVSAQVARLIIRSASRLVQTSTVTVITCGSTRAAARHSSPDIGRPLEAGSSTVPAPWSMTVQTWLPSRKPLGSPLRRVQSGVIRKRPQTRAEYGNEDDDDDGSRREPAG